MCPSFFWMSDVAETFLIKTCKYYISEVIHKLSIKAMLLNRLTMAVQYIGVLLICSYYTRLG